MAKRGRKRKSESGALSIVRAAREAAKRALDSLRSEIKATTDRLAALLAEEKSFRAELFGGGSPGRPRSSAKAAPTRARRARRKGPPLAEKFFEKLGATFTLEDVRKLAGRKAGISLAQWSRSKRIRKVGKGYQKVASDS